MEHISIVCDAIVLACSIAIVVLMLRFKGKVFELVSDVQMRFFEQLEKVREFVIEKLAKQETRTELTYMLANMTCDALCEYLDRMSDDGR